MQNVTTESDYLHIPVTPELIHEAQERSQAAYNIHGDYATTRPNSRMQGFIAEAAIKYCYPNLKYYNGTEHDLISEPSQTTIDVKSGKVTVPPRVAFDIMMLAYQTINSDILIFCSVTENFKTVIAKGFITTAEFKSLQFEIPEGAKIGPRTNDKLRYGIKGNQIYKMDEFTNFIENE